MHLVVTGGCGFIGSNFIRQVLATRPGWRITNVDKLTYAGNPASLTDVSSNPGYKFFKADICDRALMTEIFAGKPDAVVHFAAESHVDRSILGPEIFVQTNVMGTQVLLEVARNAKLGRFLHVSTDEVYGQSLGDQRFTESDPFRPRSPYAASKAGAELLAHAFVETYSLPVVIARPANNIGPRQHPEKAVPLFVTNAIEDQPLPVYGRGAQVRDRLFVEDNCEALDLLLHRGEAGEAYNIAAGNERTNIEVAETVLELLEKPKSLIRFVEDRPGHDQRYQMDATKIAALGWSPKHNFASAMEQTVDWYRENRWWWQKIKSGPYQEYYRNLYSKRLAEAKPYEG